MVGDLLVGRYMIEIKLCVECFFECVVGQSVLKDGHRFATAVGILVRVELVI